MKQLIIVGSGCAGLYRVLHLPQEKQVIIITKLESLVFAQRAAKDIARNPKKRGRIMLFDEITLKLNADPLITSAIREDITSEDVSANSVMPEAKTGVADLICKRDGIICGLPVFERVFKLMDENTEIECFVNLHQLWIFL